MELKSLPKKIPELINKHKYAVLILLIGLVFMMIPGRNEQTQIEEETQTQLIQSEVSTSEQLAQILTNIEGAGNVQVFLTQEEGEETIYQTDSNVSNSETQNTTQINTVTVTDSQRNETGLIRQVNPPTYLGAIVVCQGADSPTVRLAIVEAVSRVTGLGADRISVLKMK